MKLHFAPSNVYLVQVGETSEIRWVAKERLQKEVDVTNGFCFGTACSWLLGQGLSPGSESSISLEYSSVPVLHTLLMNPSFWIVCPSWRGLSLVILLIMQSFPSGKCEVLYGINFHLRRAILAYVSVLEVKAAFHWKIHSRVAYCCEPRFLDSLSFMLVEEEDNINEEAVHEMNALVMVEFEAWTDPLEPELLKPLVEKIEAFPEVVSSLSPGSESSISLEYSSVPVLHTLLMNPSFWIVCPSWRGLSLVILLIMQSFPSGKCEVLYGINFHLRRAILAYVSVLEVKAAFHWNIHSRVAYCCEPRFLDSSSFMLVEEEDNINEEAVHESSYYVSGIKLDGWPWPAGTALHCPVHSRYFSFGSKFFTFKKNSAYEVTQFMKNLDR
ncbi:hypothetical protein LguiB_034715 [Lonicera macranthoides]